MRLGVRHCWRGMAGAERYGKLVCTACFAHNTTLAAIQRAAHGATALV